ncbi:MAG: PcfJ domain-containing protein [Hyphomonadaceae bacterium]|nr:PcfJ domain-containing protein [Hyphomonadaceae bacterium]
MTLAYDVATRDVDPSDVGRDVARVIARDRLVERRIARFREPLQTRVRALARRHPRIGDLAVSFPALLGTLALPRRGVEAESVLARVVAGAPLKSLAQMAGVPLWLRTLKPEAIPLALPALPDSAWFAHRIANHVPRAKLVPDWLDAVGRAYAYADEAVALWVAREAAKKPLVKLPRPRRNGARDELRLVSLWAWLSLHGEMPDLMEGRFSLEMEMNAALIAAREWRENVVVHLDFSVAHAAQAPWLPAGPVGRYEFLPVSTAQELIDEAREMKHCVRTFSGAAATGSAQVFAVCEDGEHIATLMVGRRYPSPFLDVHDLRGPLNAEAPRELWRTVTNLLRTQEPPEGPSAHAYAPPCRMLWTRLWRRYWLAKRRIPDWLPLAPDVHVLWSL